MRAEVVIAVDLGGTKLAAAEVGADGSIRRRTERWTPHETQDALLFELEEAIGDLVSDAAGALGVGVPSTIDQRRGEAVSSVNVPLAGIELRARLAERFGIPVAIENDANAAALAEHRYGAGRGTRHMVMLTLGTGIGGGLVLDGDLYRGSVGAAGELGHMTIDLDGPRCQGNCPGYGHLEVLASGTAAAVLARQMAEERPGQALAAASARGRELDARLVTELAADGAPDACEVLETIGRRLGAGIATYVNVFDPEVVVLGGGFARAGELVFEPARRVVRERALPPGAELVRIVPAELGPDAGVVGAAAVAFDALSAAVRR